MIRVALADDQALIREGLKRILSLDPDVEVNLEVSNGFDLLKELRTTHCDVVILDINMAGPGFFETLRRIKEMGASRVLVLSIHPEEQYAVRALRDGACGYLHKGVVPATLIEAVRTIAAGGVFMTPSLGELLVRGLSRDPSMLSHEALSDREFEVLRLLGSGFTTEEVGNRLSISPKTVGTYRTRIYEKMGLRNPAEIVRYAVENQLHEAAAK
jgi:two-component system, NarL family, invasion response regulator UvrY